MQTDEFSEFTTPKTEVECGNPGCVLAVFVWQEADPHPSCGKALAPSVRTEPFLEVSEGRSSHVCGESGGAGVRNSSGVSLGCLRPFVNAFNVLSSGVGHTDLRLGTNCNFLLHGEL